MRLLRAALDKLYDACAWAAALMMVGTLIMVILGMVDRYVSMNFRGTDMYAGYFMAAAGFLALAHTLKKNEHIRVTLILNAVPAGAKKTMELWSLIAAVLLAGLFAYYSVRLAYQSWDFHDISTGNDATPLWIPQIAMAVGTLVLLLAFVDEFVLELTGRRQSASAEEALHNE